MNLLNIKWCRDNIVPYVIKSEFPASLEDCSSTEPPFQQTISTVLSQVYSKLVLGPDKTLKTMQANNNDLVVLSLAR